MFVGKVDRRQVALSRHQTVIVKLVRSILVDRDYRRDFFWKSRLAIIPALQKKKKTLHKWFWDNYTKSNWENTLWTTRRSFVKSFWQKPCWSRPDWQTLFAGTSCHCTQRCSRRSDSAGEVPRCWTARWASPPAPPMCSALAAVFSFWLLALTS